MATFYRKMLGYPVARGEEKSCAEINNLDSRPLLLGAHDVLRLEVHVDDVLVVQVLHLVNICRHGRKNLIGIGICGISISHLGIYCLSTP